MGGRRPPRESAQFEDRLSGAQSHPSRDDIPTESYAGSTTSTANRCNAVPGPRHPLNPALLNRKFFFSFFSLLLAGSFVTDFQISTTWAKYMQGGGGVIYKRNRIHCNDFHQHAKTLSHLRSRVRTTMTVPFFIISKTKKSILVSNSSAIKLIECLAMGIVWIERH